MSKNVSMNIRVDEGTRAEAETVKEDMEEARKLRAEGITGVDADDLAAQLDAILARAEARL